MSRRCKKYTQRVSDKGKYSSKYVGISISKLRWDKIDIFHRYTGFFAFTNPIVVIRDLDLIKQIGIKDFDHFVDHKVFMDEEAEPLFGSNLFFLKGN